MRRTEIIIPASTSNLGASFDTCGLALALYLRVTVEEEAEHFEIIPSGEGAMSVPRDESNLIARVARFVAEQRGQKISGARLLVDSQIPLARGLGSSSSAIIAGISVYELLADKRLSEEEFFRYALHFEGHGDNLAPSLLGGLVVACVVEPEEGQPSLVTIKRPWPEEVKLIAVIPELELETAKMRAALPQVIPMHDAVFNLQRAALLQAAISERRFELLSEALRDRLHQPYRAPLVLGMQEVLQLNEERDNYPGLLGVTVSGAGSTMMAFATENLGKIGAAMAARLADVGVQARVVEAEVDNRGRIEK
jgi:homoserine kinase